MKLKWTDGDGYVSWTLADGTTKHIEIYPPVLAATELPKGQGFIIVHGDLAAQYGPTDNAIAYNWNGERLYVVRYPDRNVNDGFLGCSVENEKILLSSAYYYFVVEPNTGQILSQRERR